MDRILAQASVGISELKANPNAVLAEAAGAPVAILNRNRPVAYLLPAAMWEAICERIDDLDLVRTAQERLADGQKPVEVKLDEL